ncbi:DUF3093 domain-containing protein [Luteococcus peritonei]|uniref:DUF3093 domain-containing protein n=1 Tax=Luteococcus peritonei TaxID=88874 RepID=A0ABW4RXG0_9ACTN
MAEQSTPVRHRERLHAPLGWWLVAILVALTLVVAVWAYLNIWFGAATALVCLLVIAVGLLGYGHSVVAVDEHGIQAGLAHVEWPWVGQIEVLNAKQSQAALVSHAEARNYLLTRPYVKQMVRITLADPADPHPAWLVSTRHPARFARVAEQVRPR